MTKKLPVYDKNTFYPLQTRVRAIAAGFNSKDRLGTVVSYDFFGGAQVRWDQQEVFL